MPYQATEYFIERLFSQPVVTVLYRSNQINHRPMIFAQSRQWSPPSISPLWSEAPSWKSAPETGDCPEPGISRRSISGTKHVRFLQFLLTFRAISSRVMLRIGCSTAFSSCYESSVIEAFPSLRISSQSAQSQAETNHLDPHVVGLSRDSITLSLFWVGAPSHNNRRIQ